MPLFLHIFSRCAILFPLQFFLTDTKLREDLAPFNLLLKKSTEAFLSLANRVQRKGNTAGAELRYFDEGIICYSHQRR